MKNLFTVFILVALASFVAQAAPQSAKSLKNKSKAMAPPTKVIKEDCPFHNATSNTRMLSSTNPKPAIETSVKKQSSSKTDSPNITQ